MEVSDAAKPENAEVQDVPAVDVPPEPAPYRMPSICVNDSVLWYDSGDTASPGHPAVILQVDADSVKLRIVGVGVTEPYRTGVRHVSDPKLKQNHHVREAGGWEYSSSTRKLMDVVSLASSLSERVRQLEHRLETVGLGAEGVPSPKKKAS